MNGLADNLCPFHLIGCKDTIKDKNELSNHLVMSVHRHVTVSKHTQLILYLNENKIFLLFYIFLATYKISY